MTDSRSSPDVAPGVPLEAVLCTEALDRRPSRPPDYAAENRALVSLAQALADSPGTILQTLADTILDVFGAESAGVSLVTPDERRFYWPAVAGVWQPHIGGGTPRDFGPCGDVLDRNMPLLFLHLERRYTYFQLVAPLPVEALLVPFYVEGKAVGTIWAVTHNPQARQFDHEDRRLLVSLGRFASSAYWAVESLGKLEHQAKSLLEVNEALLLASVRQQQLSVEAEQVTDRLARLQKVTAALSEAVTPAQVAEVMVNQGTRALGAVSASVLVLSADGQTLEMLSSAAPVSVIRLYQRFSISLDVPVAEAVRLGQPIWIESRQHYLDRYPHLADQIAAWGHESAAALPLGDQRRRLGALALSFDQAQAFGAEDQVYALTLAHLCTQALERARLYEVEQQQNDQLEQRVQRRTNELLHSETRFQLLVNSVQDYAIFMLDPQGKIVSWNSGAQRMKGYAPAEIIGQHFSRFYTPEDNAQGQPMHGLSVAALAGRYEVEGWRVRQDGSRFWADVVISAVHNEAGELIGFAKVTRDLTDRRQIDEEVRQSREQLRDLAARSQAAREEERARVSRELHDQLGGALTALKMDIAKMHRQQPKGEAQADVQPLMTAVDDMVKLTRQLATELRPGVLDDFGLAAAVEWQLQEFEKRSGIRTRFHLEETEVELDKDTTTAIFRIFQETLTNIARHAQASEVDVQLEHHMDRLVLRVHDNGRGINTGALTNRKSLGLVGMRERVRLLSGELTMEGADGQGTTVLVKIPLPAA